MGKSIKQALQDALDKKAAKSVAKNEHAAPIPTEKPTGPAARQSVTQMTGKARATLYISKDRAEIAGPKRSPNALSRVAPGATSERMQTELKPNKDRVPLSRPPSKPRPSAAQAIHTTLTAEEARKADRLHQQALANIANVYAAKERATATTTVVQPLWKLEIEPSAVPNPFLIDKAPQYDVLPPSNSGIAEQMPGTANSDDPREMVIGLDFGTSSVKVIVGDMAASSAYAVPFSDVEGVERYLLPSRLWQTNDCFSILGGTNVHRDLKLALLNEGDADEAILRAGIFLALVLRHVRGWLLSEHAETYANTKFVWKVMLGIPAKKYEAEPARPYLNNRFRLVGRAAWLIAGKHIKEINLAAAQYGIERADQLMSGSPPRSESEEVDVDVVPEISAQIYGFLNSDRFDSKAANRFMMVDVGAGTVDSSLFQVERGKRGKWNFRFYTSEVQPLGVLNLHRARVHWWAEALKKQGAPGQQLFNALVEHKYATDFLGAIPEQLEDYVTGVRLTFRDAKSHPDHEFFMLRVMRQVRGSTLYRAKDYLNKENLAGIPAFLCGGGTRMKYYGKLAEELKQFPGVSWLNAKVRPLEKPNNLQAPSLAREDYDRLSVAFGLSFLEVGEIVKALAEPIAIGAENVTSYQDRFVSKDQM